MLGISMGQIIKEKWIDTDYRKMGLFSGIIFILLTLILIVFLIYSVMNTEIYAINKKSNDDSLFILIFFFLVVFALVFFILYLASRYFVKVSRLCFRYIPIETPTQEIEQVLEDMIATLNMPYQKSKKEVMKGTYYEIKFEMIGEGIGITLDIIKDKATIQLNITLTFKKELSGSFEEDMKLKVEDAFIHYLNMD
jgi:hypothetical protein